MTLPRPLLLLTAALVAAAPVVAQESGCTQADPCPWVVHVDADGFVFPDDGQAGWAWDVGDVTALDIFVDDNATHTLTLDGYGLAIDAPGFDDEEGPYTEYGTLVLDEAGAFTFTDETTGATATVRVIGEDETTPPGDGGMVDGMDGGDDGGENGSPMGGVLLVTAALVAAAVLLRRRP